MKYYNIIPQLVILLTLVSAGVKGQISDDFSDGDFTNNPTWIGETTHFEVDGDNQLHQIAPALDSESYLSTTNTAIDNVTWEFWVKMTFPTSSN